MTINPNLSGNPRFDTVIVSIDWALQTIRLSVKEGIPSAAPSAPTLTVNEGTLVEIEIAYVAVVSGAVSITNAYITQRLQPLVRYYDMVKTVTAGTATSSFLDEWNGLDYKSFPVLFVEYDDQSEYFISYDSGITWYRIATDYTITTVSDTASGTSVGGTQGTLFHTEQVTAVRDHVIIQVYCYTKANTNGAVFRRSRIVIEKNGIELHAVQNTDGLNTGEYLYTACTLAMKIPCSVGDVFDIDFYWGTGGSASVEAEGYIYV